MSTSVTHNEIMEAGAKDRASMLVVGNVLVLAAPATKSNPGSSEETKSETYSTIDENTKKRIAAKAKALHIILIRINNDGYSTVDACANAKELWIAIKCLMHEENYEEEVVKTMTETMKQYMSKTQDDYGSGIAASRWLRNKPSGSVKTCEDLKTKFLSKYCPPARTAKKMEINNFQQELDETLYQVWDRFKELLMKYLQHYLIEMQE
nr:hypothetical protein [Tanacetum cinerariifolium]